MPAPKLRKANGKKNEREQNLALGERSERTLAKRKKGSGTSKLVFNFDFAEK
jgi:hypothetical protein